VFRSTAQRADRRAAYIDWARGIAVLLMIEAHTLDAWTRPSSRASTAFAYASMAAGFAAPLFLWLAGLAIPLSASSALRRGASRRFAAEHVCKRGLEIFILAFLFRLQAFTLTPGAHPITLFRVDILNVMGPAIVGCGVLWLWVESTPVLVAAYGVVAIAVAMSAPLVRTATLISGLPIWMQWYIRPAADNTTFTAFPGVGVAFAGAAVGVLVAKARESAKQVRLFAGVGLGGAALVGLGFFTASLPSIYSDSSFWTTSPAYFAIRAGAMMAALGALFAIDRAVSHDGAIARTVERFGRSSLFVYWIHVELVYGYASWPIRRRLPLWGTAVAYIAFAAFVFAAVKLRDRMAERWRSRSKQITFRYKAETV
jgi:uncharacterized membrane protein